MNRFVTTCLQTCNNLCVFTRVVVTSLQANCNKSVHKLSFALYIITVSTLLEQSCNKFDNIKKVVTICQELVLNLLTTFHKPCYTCKIFTCVDEINKYSS